MLELLTTHILSSKQFAVKVKKKGSVKWESNSTIQLNFTFVHAILIQGAELSYILGQNGTMVNGCKLQRTTTSEDALQ